MGQVLAPLALLALLALSTSAMAQGAPPAYVDDGLCAGCHEAQHGDWLASHHRHAMAPASPESVQGDFDDALFSHDGKTTRFFRQGADYFVETEGPDGEVAAFRVPYTFGTFPLQQYLVALPGGRLQALDIAWDVAGRRWFRLLPDQATAPGDYLHWTGGFYNWNTTCAACHSTDLRKNYDPDSNSFATTWAAINVGCQACHGPGEAHLRWAEEGGGELGLVAAFDAQSAKTEIEVCAPCHSRRRQIATHPVPGESLLDSFAPELLRDDLYHGDGQILDEVYVYGSFLQSPMHQAGVRCSDCHNPHSGALQVAGNGLCTRCHNETPPARFASLKAGDYDSPAHHHHALGGAGALCVDCHMAARTYMEVDPRRDHSFRVPRPDLSIKLGTPNACTGCHDDRGDLWAAEQVAAWFGTARRMRPHYGEILQAARLGVPGADRALVGLITDKAQPAIVRATGLSLLPRALGPEAIAAYQAGLSDADPLVRAAALAALEPFPPEQRWQAAGHLLRDPRRAVRIAAARLLAATPQSLTSAAEAGQLEAALAEARDAELVVAERPEAHLNLGALAAARGRAQEAEAAYRRALALDPGFAPALVNLADLYRGLGRDSEALAALDNAVASDPTSAEAHYALGLARVRQGQTEGAIAALARADELAPDDPRFGYGLGLALNDGGRWAEATRVLRRTHERHPRDTAVLVALVTFYRDKGFTELALVYARKLVALNPNEQAAQKLLESLR